MASRSSFSDDLVRGVVLTDALIGTFADAHDPALRQNRCFLYHVIGGGTGDWDVPVGGMGALTDALAAAARAAGAEIVATGHEAMRIETDGERAEVTYRLADGEGTVDARGTSWSTPPRGSWPPCSATSRPRRPRAPSSRSTCCCSGCRGCGTRSVDPREAFSGTFHIAEGYEPAGDRVHAEAASGGLPERAALGDLLPLAHRPVHPRPGPGRSRATRR